jgi:hypothetical protein
MLAVFPMDALELSVEMNPIDKPLKTHWVRDAVFYFEAETTLKMLVLQRRRWLNGTMAGNVYMAANMKSIVYASKHSWWVKLCTTVMIWMQLLQAFVLALGPGIFASILFGVTNSIATHYIDPGQHNVQLLAKDENSWEIIGRSFRQPQIQLAMSATAVYLTSYLVFLRVHRCSARTPFCQWAWVMVTLLNLLIISLLVWALALTHHTFGDEFDNFMGEVHREFHPGSVTAAPVACPAACGSCPLRGTSWACCSGNTTCARAGGRVDQARCDTLNDHFEHGTTASANLDGAGVVTHQFDFEHAETLWRPGPGPCDDHPRGNDQWCAMEDRVSCSLLSAAVSLSVGGAVHLYRAPEEARPWRCG